MTKSSQKSVKIVYLFLESIYPEMQRKHIPKLVATHQPDAVLVDI